MTRLAGKVALVAGGTRGIGRATALAFGREGARVAVTGRSVEAGEEVAAAIRAAGGEAIFIATDVTDEASVERAVRRTVEAYGGVHILFNNAGGSSPKDGDVASVGLDEFWRVITLDLFGSFLAARHAVPEIVRSGGGAVINNASMAGVAGTAGRAGYCSAKGGVIALTRAMAKDFMTQRVRVNAVAPALVRTERIAAMIEAHPQAQSALASQPLGLIEPEEVAAAVVYLASDDAVRITGQVLEITGGAA